MTWVRFTRCLEQIGLVIAFEAGKLPETERDVIEHRDGKDPTISDPLTPKWLSK
jgi:hypothetical protein